VAATPAAARGFVPNGPRPHRELCPFPDTEHQLRMRGNRPRPQCTHKFTDGKPAWRVRHFQIDGHPAEGMRCAMCRLQIVMYFEEEYL
jgi:hypothetical protein